MSDGASRVDDGSDSSAVAWAIEVFDEEKDAWVRGSASLWNAQLSLLTVTVAALDLDALPLEPSPELRLVSCEDDSTELFERVRDLVAKSGEAPQTSAERAVAHKALAKKDRKEVERAEKAAAQEEAAAAAASEKEAKASEKAAAKEQAAADKAAIAEQKASAKASVARQKKAASPTEALGMAARQGDLSQIEQLLEAMPKASARKKALNSRGFEGMTALYWACTYGHLEIVEFLLKGGARVNLPGKGGVTPLMGAAFAGKTAAARLLLAHKASIYKKDSSGLSALKHATRHNPLTKSGQLREELQQLVGLNTFSQKLKGSAVCAIQ
jgi:chemotaxis protein histidine kinase CheA